MNIILNASIGGLTQDYFFVKYEILWQYLEMISVLLLSRCSLCAHAIRYISVKCRLQFLGPHLQGIAHVTIFQWCCNFWILPLLAKCAAIAWFYLSKLYLIDDGWE